MGFVHPEGRSPLCQLTWCPQGFWDTQSPHSICRDAGNELREQRRLPSCAASSCWGCRDQLHAGGQELPAELEEKPYDLYGPFRGERAGGKAFYFQQNLGMSPLPSPCKTCECNKANVSLRVVQAKTMHLILTPVYNWATWQILAITSDIFHSLT